ncbi:MAG: hypothetical protein Q9168_002365 [Polycauliona sp. 1 TL-2023]
MDVKAARQYGAITSMTRSNGFDSQIFTVIVGLHGKAFTAHAAFLSKSPVFDKMCSGRFQEGQTFEIKLPEDEPRAIAALIEYLYSGKIQNYVLGSGQTPEDVGSELAELYMTQKNTNWKDSRIWH